jgi:hypothetical protein
MAQMLLYGSFAVIVAVAVVTPALAQRTDPPVDTIQPIPLITTLVTPILITDDAHAGSWLCTALGRLVAHR